MFSPGDRVVCVKDHPYGNESICAGDYGTVVCSSEVYDIDVIPVCWDYDVGGHNCGNANYEFGHGWYTPKSYLEAVEDEFDDTFEFPDISNLFA